MKDDTSDRFDQRLRQAAQTYHEPPATPREELWAAIQAERQHRRQARPVLVIRPWVRWGLGIAAILALGIGIGRWTASERPVQPQTAAEFSNGGASSGVAYRLAATQHLTRTEALLTEFRSGERRAGLDAQFRASAEDQLANTRLMLDSPAAADPRLRALLEELELVLAQITQLAAGGDSVERDLITQGLERSGVMPRLRTAIPAGPLAARAAGAL